MNDPTQAPDQRTRRHAIATLALLACVGFAAHIALDGLLADIEAEGIHDPGSALARMRSLVWWLALAIAGSIGVLAATLASIAHRTRRADRFPPPGMAMLRTTRIVTGRAAQRRALLTYAAAIILAIAAVAFMWRVERLITVLAG